MNRIERLVPGSGRHLIRGAISELRDADTAIQADDYGEAIDRLESAHNLVNQALGRPLLARCTKGKR